NARAGVDRAWAGYPDYPMRINRDAHLAFVQAARPLLPVVGPASPVVLVTSHWAPLYGTVTQLRAYEPVARSKHAGEQALRELLVYGEPAIRLLVVTRDLEEGTVTPKLLERASSGVADQRKLVVAGRL